MLEKTSETFRGKEILAKMWIDCCGPHNDNDDNKSVDDVTSAEVGYGIFVENSTFYNRYTFSMKK